MKGSTHQQPQQYNVMFVCCLYLRDASRHSGVGPRNTNDGLSSKVLPVPIILGLEPPGAVQALLKAVRETTGGN